MINIAILGCGTVGSGVAKLLTENKLNVKDAIGEEVRVKYILDVRDFSGTPYENIAVKDINIILNDPEIKIICETMGGKNPAFEYSKAALERGVSVCTSNKELVDAFGCELTETAEKNNCSYLFEASVGGGIPVLRAIRNLKHEKINSITGILNGTCNYILTRMKDENMELSDALKIAQEKGFAEKNPDADILGHDAGRKIAILASLVSGERVSYEKNICCEGIDKINKNDFIYAARLGGNIKLLGIYRAGYKALVAPFLIFPKNPLYGVNDVFNGILIHGNMADNLMFYGRGAGKLPTASAVVSDVIECAKNSGKFIDNGLNFKNKNNNEENKKELKFRNFVMINESSGGNVRKIFEDENFIDEIINKNINNEFTFITQKISDGEFNEKISGISGLKSRIRILDAE